MTIHTTTVAMLSNDPSMTTACCNIQPLAHQEPKPTRIQIRARPNHPVLRQPAQLPCHVGEDVHGVTHNQQYTIRTVLHQLRDDTLEDVRVTLHQIQPSLTLTLPGTGRHDTQLRTRCYSVIYTRKMRIYTWSYNIPQEKTYLY